VDLLEETRKRIETNTKRRGAVISMECSKVEATGGAKSKKKQGDIEIVTPGSDRPRTRKQAPIPTKIDDERSKGERGSD